MNENIKEIVESFVNDVSNGTYSAPYEYNAPELDGWFVMISFDDGEHTESGEGKQYTIELRAEDGSCVRVGFTLNLDIDEISKLVEKAIKMYSDYIMIDC